MHGSGSRSPLYRGTANRDRTLQTPVAANPARGVHHAAGHSGPRYGGIWDTIHHLGLDPGRYVPTFDSLQWQGTDEEADDNRRGTWHVFHLAQGTRDHGARVSTNDLRAAAQGGSPEVLHIPGTQERAAQVYEPARQEHIARTKLRG